MIYSNLEYAQIVIMECIQQKRLAVKTKKKNYNK